jgi:hypothetical protein
VRGYFPHLRLFSGCFTRPTGDLGLQLCRSTVHVVRLHGSHILWLRFPADSPSRRIGNSTYAVLQPPKCKHLAEVFARHRAVEVNLLGMLRGQRKGLREVGDSFPGPMLLQQRSTAVEICLGELIV